MTGERSFAYAGLMRSLRRLEAVGGLLPDEGDQIRAAADALLFADKDSCADELGAVDDALSLIEGLVKLGRWPRQMAGRTLDALAACGPEGPPAVPVAIDPSPGITFGFGRRSPGRDPRSHAA